MDGGREKEATGWRLKKHRNNRISEKDTNKTAPKVYIPPLKAAIRAVHRRQIDIKWAESWANRVKRKRPPSSGSYPQHQGSTTTQKGQKTGKCAYNADENREDRPRCLLI